MRSNGESQNTRGVDFSIIEKFFIRPQLTDPNQQRIARIIHTLSTFILLAGFAVFLFSPFIFDGLLLGYLITCLIIIVMFIVQVLNRKGKLRAAANLFVYFIWAVDTLIIFLSQGFHSEYLPSYIAITVMGGLILGGVSAFRFAGLSLVSILIFYYLDSMGFMIEPLIIFNHLSLFIIFALNIFMAALVLILVIRKYEDTFEQLIDNEQALFRSNLDLKWENEAREQAETYLKQSEERFKAALMDSPYPTMLHAEDGEILIINTAWIEKCGYSREEFSTLGELHSQIFREGAFDVSEELRKITTKAQTRSEGYFPIFTKDGKSQRWYFRWAILPEFPDGRCIILTIAFDMTNLTDIESALRRSEEHLSKLSLVTNDGIWDWDLKTDQVVFDPRYFTMAGYEVDEFPHQLEEFRKRVHPDDVDAVFNQANGHLAGDIERYAVEFRFLTKDGSWLWIFGRGKIVEQDENGNPLRFVGTHTDISDRKIAEEELNLYQQKLENIVDDRTQKLENRIAEVEKLNAALSNILDDYQISNEKLSWVSSNLSDANLELESFTQIVSNDLRGPIHTILELSEVLTKNDLKKIGNKSSENISEIKGQAVKIENLVNDLLKLSRLSQVEFNLGIIDPVILVKEILELFDDEIKERKIEIDVKDLPPCKGDIESLKMVFHNLIGNAIQFTAKKKKPEIIIGYQPDQSSAKVIYYVKDNGVGFSMGDQEKVFETFQRIHTEDIFKGAGIGLALAKKIVNKHGGEIWVEAKKNRGATFYFDLDRAE